MIMNLIFIFKFAASKNRRNTINPELTATTVKIVIGFDNFHS